MYIHPVLSRSSRASCFYADFHASSNPLKLLQILVFLGFFVASKPSKHWAKNIASKETWHELPISFKKAKRHRVKSYSGHVCGRWLTWSTWVHGSSPSNIHIRLAGDLLGQGNSSFCLLQWSFREGWFLGGELEMVTLDFSVSWPKKSL